MRRSNHNRLRPFPRLFPVFLALLLLYPGFFGFRRRALDQRRSLFAKLEPCDSQPLPSPSLSTSKLLFSPPPFVILYLYDLSGIPFSKVSARGQSEFAKLLRFAFSGSSLTSRSHLILSSSRFNVIKRISTDPEDEIRKNVMNVRFLRSPLLSFRLLLGPRRNYFFPVSSRRRRWVRHILAKNTFLP